jgi:hypothetical protein
MTDITERLRLPFCKDGELVADEAVKDMRDAANEIELLRAAIRLVRGIIIEGAAVGFNPLDGGDWATRLFTSQATTFEALHGRRGANAALSSHKRGGET